jgi:hypothetical protein
MPPREKTAISMFSVDQLTENEIWDLGDYAGKNRGKAALARGDIECKSIFELHMRVEPTPEDHPRHVNIAGWPTEKDKRKALALEFCARSTLHIRS